MENDRRLIEEDIPEGEKLFPDGWPFGEPQPINFYGALLFTVILMLFLFYLGYRLAFG